MEDKNENYIKLHGEKNSSGIWEFDIPSNIKLNSNAFRKSYLLFKFDEDNLKKASDNLKKVIDDDLVIPPKKRGRPRNNLIKTEDGENRKSKVNNIYLKNRYRDDPVFREKCKLRRRYQYALSKNKQILNE